METAQNGIGITHQSKPVLYMQANRVPGSISQAHPERLIRFAGV